MSSSNPPNNSDVSNDNSNNIQGTSINSSHHYKFEGIDVKDHASFRLGNPPSLKSSATSIEDGSHIRISEGEGEGEGENGAQGRNTSTKASGVSEVDNPLPFRDDPSPPSHPQKKDIPPSWSSLPHKGQLVILTLARLSEPLTDTSLQAYMFYQLKSFNPELPDSTISTRAGALQVCFTAAQFVTAVFWGRAADSERCGRKRVLLIGLLGTCLSCVGFGFSRSFIQAAIFRSIGGALNGNVGVLRTMIAEIIKEKKYQSRAFSLLPMCFNIGVIIGPVLGGLLADPVASYPHIFGKNSVFGGKEGVWWMKHWPYALPNLVSAIFLAMSVTCVVLGLEETHVALRDKPDLGLRVGHFLANTLRCPFIRRSYKYTKLDNNDDQLDPSISSFDLEDHPRVSVQVQPTSQKPPRAKLPFRRIFTSNVLLTLTVYAIQALHIRTFNSLWFIFLSTSRFNPSHPTPPHYHPRPPFIFTGGLGLPPARVGLAMSILGVIGITLQLFLYPRLSHRLGTLRSYRLFVPFSGLAYILVPFLALVPSTTPPPSPASGALVWLALASILFVQVLARTFTLPAITILLNNCSPHPSVLGTIHGIGQAASSATRTVGPLVGAWGLGKGLEKGVVGATWWGLSGVVTVGWIAGVFIFEGNGHEIVLEGDEGFSEGKDGG